MLPSGVTSLLSALGSAWLPVLVDAAVKGTVILIVASVVSLLVRRASAAARHLVWFLALVGLLGLPALSVALPGWQVLPGWFGVGQTAALDAEEAATASAAVEPAVPPAADSPPWSAGHSAGRPKASPSRPRPLGAASGPPPAPAAEVSRSWSAKNLRIWILPLWAAGAALSLAPVAIGLVSLRRLRRTSRRVADGPWASLLERLSAELGLKRRVAMLQSSRRSMPMAWGLVRPKLLIPDEADGWSAECLRAVLLHELAHVKRWDCLTQLVARMACGLYWFNPLAWLALHRMVAEHERACDDVVLAAGGRAPEYAEHLLKVASRLPAVRLSMGVGIALARPSKLEGRLLAILDRKRSRRAVTRAAALGAILAMAALLMPLAVMRPMVQAEQTAAEQTKDARTLDLRGKKATDAGLAKLKEAGDLDVLYVSGDGITDAGLKELKDLKGLKTLGLVCCDKITDVGIKEVGVLAGLRELHLVNTGVSDAGLAELKGLDALEVLYLSGPKITDAGLRTLKDFKRLREVCLLGPSFTDAGLKELKDLKDLRALHLRSPGITDAGLRELKGFASLQVLSLPDTSITDAGLAELKGLGALRELNLRYTKVTDAGMQDVKEFKALESLDITYTNVTDAGLKELEGLKGLRELRCVGAAVTEAGVERLRKALPEAKITAGPGAGARPTLEPSAGSEAAAPPHPAATPILKIRSADGAAVADVHNGMVRVRLGDKTVEGPTIIISLDAGAGVPRKGIVLGVRDGAVRMTAKGTETIGAMITIHPDGRTEVRSREATDGSLKGPAPAGTDAVRTVEPGRAESGNALPADDGAKRAGQHVFPLKYQEADASEAVVSGNTFQRSLPGKPAEVKTVPTGLSGEAVYFSLTVGPRKVLALLEVASPPRLFVDVAGTGDLSAVQPLTARPWGPVQQFGPVDIPVNGKDRPAARVRFLCAADKYLAANKDLAVAPAGYMAGEVSLDGQPYRVALVDHGLSGRYDNVLRGKREFGWLKEDTRLALDLNQDGDFPRSPDTGETLPLLPALHVKDAYYSVRAAPDGSSIVLASAAPDFGTLDTGCADLSLALVGEYGFHKLSGSGGKWRIPAGWHAATGATLNRTDGAGTLWSLHGVSSWGRLARFDIRTGETLSLRAGSPLSVKVHPSGLQPNGMIHFALALVGQAGEDYNAAPKKGDVAQPPRFRVLDEAGRAIGSGVFNPGTEGTYSWCWWRVPEGFRGKYHVEVEGDWGPFEIARSEPEWFSAR
jgi:beta-lactamase regulating signal transducer with metallopeptidase domain